MPRLTLSVCTDCAAALANNIPLQVVVDTQTGLPSCAHNNTSDPRCKWCKTNEQKTCHHFDAL